MSGAKKFWVWLLFVILGCGGGLETVPASGISKEGASQQRYGKADNGAEDGVGGGTLGTAYGLGLCMDRRSGAPNRVIFTPKSKDAECEYAQDSRGFTASREEAVVLELHGVSYVSYRIDVVRQSGYITISHRAGDVVRNGDTFTWDVVPRSEQPLEARVRSLTANSNFEIVVR